MFEEPPLFHGPETVPPDFHATESPVSGTSVGLAGQVPLEEKQSPAPFLTRFSMTPIVSVQATFDDNIFISHNHKEADLYHTVRAGIAIGWGDFRDGMTDLGRFQQRYEGLGYHDVEERDYLYASYTPGATLFASHSGEDTFDQDAALGGHWLMGKLSFDIHSNFQRYSEAFVDTGSRERISRMESELGATYRLNEKTSIETEFFQRTRLYDNAKRIDYTEWSNQDYFNFYLQPKTTIAAGVRFGFLDPSRGPQQTFEQLVVRLQYDSQSKLRGGLLGGFELRQFESGGDDTTPIFGLNLNYKPLDGTDITLFGARRIVYSAESLGENVTATSVGVHLEQEIMHKSLLTVEASYENRDYGQIAGSGGTQREDNVFNIGAELAFHVTKWTQVSVSYNYWHNSSTETNFSFDDNRVSVRFELLF